MLTSPETPQTLTEVEVPRLKAAHLEWQLTQVQAQQLSERRDALIRQTMLAYVSAEEINQYVIDLEAGVVRRREHRGRQENEHERG